jgi:hypothetical protein
VQLAKKRQADLKLIERSPSLGSSDIDPSDMPLSFERKSTCSGVYIYCLTEYIGYKTLAAYAEARLGYSVTGWVEAQIVEKLDILESYQTPTMATSRINSSVSS